jgi:hypothetical protein
MHNASIQSHRMPSWRVIVTASRKVPGRLLKLILVFLRRRDRDVVVKVLLLPQQ